MMNKALECLIFRWTIHYHYLAAYKFRIFP